MKLLLTSTGITNESIAKALDGLIGKPRKDVKIGYIPTAANMESGNKDWYIAQLTNLQNHGFYWIDIVEIADSDVDYGQRLSEVDVIFVSGGNTFHLLNKYRETGFGKWLEEALKTKIYVGVSAGSIVMTPSIEVANIPPRDQNYNNIKDLSGMNFVDFEVEPHCEGDRFKVVEEYSKTSRRPIYAIDDDSVVMINDNEVSVITEGEWKKYDV